MVQGARRVKRVWPPVLVTSFASLVVIVPRPRPRFSWFRGRSIENKDEDEDD